jgi:beta-galactosidase
MGFLIMDEAFDVWARQKAELDYHAVYPEWHERDLLAMLRRDRSHPSVILWGLGNEVARRSTAWRSRSSARSAAIAARSS